MQAYELAAKMQLAVPRVTDLSGETAATLALYGLDQETTAPFGRNCLLARRLLEQGVRFVQLFSGGAFGSPRINWDGHEDVKANHTQEAARIDQPVAGLLADLRQRGMLDDTLVLFTTEFGRTPFTQSAADKVGTGRDHNQYGFSRLAGRRGAEARPRLRRDRRHRLESGREPRRLARLPRHRAAPAGHRPRAADVLPQRHPAPADERARRGGAGDSGVGCDKAAAAAGTPLLDGGPAPLPLAGRHPTAFAGLSGGRRRFVCGRLYLGRFRLLRSHDDLLLGAEAAFAEGIDQQAIFGLARGHRELEGYAAVGIGDELRIEVQAPPELGNSFSAALACRLGFLPPFTGSLAEASSWS